MVRIKWKLKERQIYKLFIKIQSRNHRIYITVMAFFLGFFKGKKSVFSPTCPLLLIGQSNLHSSYSTVLKILTYIN